MVWRSEITLTQSPKHFFARLHHHFSSAVFLENAMPQQPFSRYSILVADPIASLICQLPQVLVKTQEGTKSFDSLWSAMRFTLAEYAPPDYEPSSTFNGGCIGFLSYDLGVSFWKEKIPYIPNSLPEAYFLFYDWSLVYDHFQERWLFYGDQIRLQEMVELDKQTKNQPFPEHDVKVGEIHSNFSCEQYCQLVEEIQELIRQGTVYQVNLSRELHASFQGEPLALYQKLVDAHPASYCAFIPFSQHDAVLSVSPELFFKLHNRKVTVRPIKGTAPRFEDSAKDFISRQQLKHSEKDFAELMMIVDLERNDLGRVCAVGSVHVPKLWQLETFASVHHLVSTIEGMLDEQYDVFDLIQSLFPCGSITGTPKLSAMQQIAKLEKRLRGVYTGSVGWISFDGNAEFNVAIRTPVVHQQQLSIGLGGGIVIDSNPLQEYEETLHKGKKLIETLNLWSSKLSNQSIKLSKFD